MTTFGMSRDGALLHGFDSGVGDLTLVFQHGLGGDLGQVAGNIADTSNIRRLTLECRAHGASTPGDGRPFSMAMFADDILAACDARGIGRIVVGGISMGPPSRCASRPGTRSGCAR